LSRNPYRERRAKNQKCIPVWVKAEIYEQFKAAADTVQEPVAAWVRRAALSSLRRWKVPKADQSVWGICSICGVRHNRNEHFSQE
jgi:hypothetical protein